MANTSLNLVGLDFENIKENLKQYLSRSDSPFKDYLYDGSNMAALIDVMAYNSYLNSYYLNMVASEMFLDTAQLRDSVVSHGKELNYTPRSFRSSQAEVSFVVTPITSMGSLLVPKNTTFTTRVGSNTYTFSTDENQVVPANTDGKFYVTSTIYEGAYVNDSYAFNSSNSIQRFILTNPTIDTRSLNVTVIENNGANIYSYSRATSFLGLRPSSNVYFLQAAENAQYELVFGDNVISRRPKDGAIIIAEYRVSNGQLPNGASFFDIDGPISGQPNISEITTISEARGGDINETVESIRFNAPRYFQNQERAVTTTDYENLLLSNFPEIQAVSAYGGEEAENPVYGKVFVSVDIQGLDGVPDASKRQYEKFLKERSPLSIDPVVINPEFTYLDIYSVVRYNVNLTPLKVSDMQAIVTATISRYNNDNLSNFKKTLRYSKLITEIDKAHNSILSNDTYIRPYKVIYPDTERPTNYVLSYGFPISSFNNITPANLAEERHSITSSQFIFDGKICTLESDSNGKLNIITMIDDTHQVVKEVGLVDFKGGKVTINNFYAQYTTNGINIYVDSEEKDIVGNRNVILNIKDQDIKVDVIALRE